MKEKNGSLQKRIFCGLTALATAAMVFPATIAVAAVDPATDVDTANKTVTVTQEDGSNGIQEAIDYINTLDDKTGWTVSVESGTYNRFVVLPDMTGLTVEEADNADVTIQVLNGSDPGVAWNSWIIDMGGIQVLSQDVTIEGFDITLGTVRPSNNHHMNAAISTFNEGGVRANGLTIADCVFYGNSSMVQANPSYGADGNVGFAFGDIDSFTVQGCTFYDLSEALRGQADNADVQQYDITGNTFDDCAFSVHMYAGDDTENGYGTINFVDNIVIGSAEIRNKVYFEDQYKGNTLDDCDGFQVNVSENTLTNAIIGMVNLADDGATKTAIEQNNTCNAGTFVVFAQKGTAGDVQAEVSAVYGAPEGATGHWELAIADDVPADSLPEIQQAIDDANLNGSTTLQFTTGSFNTFTWYKDCVYWVTEKPNEPAMDKKAETTDPDYNIGDVAFGDVVSFTLNTTLPENLSTQYLVFYDTMSGLSLDASSVEVTIDGSALNPSYFVLNTAPENGVTFTVTLDIQALYKAGIITNDMLGEASVVVSYDANVTASSGAIQNSAYVNDSNVDTVTGTVGGGDTPETGGTGTTLFTIGGGAMLAAAGTLFVISRRKGSR